MKKISMFLIVIILLVIAGIVYLFYQKKLDTPQQPQSSLPQQQSNYVSGEILIGFNQGVTEDEITKMFASKSQEYSPVIDVNGYKWVKIKIPSDKEEEYINFYRKEAIVREATVNTTFSN